MERIELSPNDLPAKLKDVEVSLEIDDQANDGVVVLKAGQETHRIPLATWVKGTLLSTARGGEDDGSREVSHQVLAALARNPTGRAAIQRAAPSTPSGRTDDGGAGIDRILSDWDLPTFPGQQRWRPEPRERTPVAQQTTAPAAQRTATPAAGVVGKTVETSGVGGWTYRVDGENIHATKGTLSRTYPVSILQDEGGQGSAPNAARAIIREMVGGPKGKEVAQALDMEFDDLKKLEFKALEPRKPRGSALGKTAEKSPKPEQGSKASETATGMPEWMSSLDQKIDASAGVNQPQQTKPAAAKATPPTSTAPGIPKGPARPLTAAEQLRASYGTDPGYAAKLREQQGKEGEALRGFFGSVGESLGKAAQKRVDDAKADKAFKKGRSEYDAYLKSVGG